MPSVILLLCTVLYTCTERIDWDLIKYINRRNSGRKEISFLPQPEWIFPGHEGCICVVDHSSTRGVHDTVASELCTVFVKFSVLRLALLLLSSFLSTPRLHCKIVFAASSVVVL